MNLVQRYILLILLPLMVGGCTIKQVSVVNTGAGGALSAGPGAIRSYATFGDIKEGYRIRGMISTAVLPIAKNKAEAREALAREAAAGLGVDTLVGLTSLTEPVADYSQYAHSCAILVNTGVPPSEKQPDHPKFIVCLLPVRLKTTKTNIANKIEACLAPELQFHLAQKGYYTYRCNSTRVVADRLLAGEEMPGALAEPLGTLPDFVLDCAIEEGSHLGLQALLMRVALYDLKEKRIVWEWSDPVVQWGLLEQLTSKEKKWSLNDSDLRQDVHDAVKGYSETRKLSPVTGFGKLRT